MPVTTINLNDFLTQKDSGDVVTGADWNKLVSLFHAVNGNASALLNLMKSVDTNTANIAQVSQGAVPDGSIDYSKLSKLGGTTNKYVLTSDDTPVTGVTYYTLENNKYIAHTDLTAFETGVKYYTLEVVATQPAIAGSDVIGDGVIQSFNLAPHSLLPSACSEFLLGGLLNDNAIVYTDKGVTGTFPEYTADTDKSGNIVEHTITFEKQHKAFIIINKSCISVLCAAPDKPDLYIGLTVNATDASDVEFTINHLSGANKRNAEPQKMLNGKYQSWLYKANAPVGLTGNSSVQLACCYYDYETKSIKLKFKHWCTQRTEVNDQYDYIFPAVTYSFGDLIIGL